jgi:hypothetical protein
MKNSNIIDSINKLPIDIILRIIPFTYHLQNKNLLDDIVSYKKTKKTLFKIYYNYWIINAESGPEEDKNWLINDIFAYANNYNATMYGYADKFYNIFKRNNYLQTKVDINKYVYNLEKKKVETQINIFLGLLTIKERSDIIAASP